VLAAGESETPRRYAMLPGVRVFALQADSDRFSRIRPEAAERFDRFIDGFACEPMAATWSAPPVNIADVDLPVGDFTSVFGSVVAFSARAKALLEPLFEGHGEWLPLSELPYWVFNTLAEADVLDSEASDGDWFAPDRVMHLRRLAVRTTEQPLPVVFKLPEWKKGPSFVTEYVMLAVEKQGLTGLSPELTASA
jgi:hypothetical protein